MRRNGGSGYLLKVCCPQFGGTESTFSLVIVLWAHCVYCKNPGRNIVILAQLFSILELPF